MEDRRPAPRRPRRGEKATPTEFHPWDRNPGNDPGFEEGLETPQSPLDPSDRKRKLPDPLGAAIPRHARFEAFHDRLGKPCPGPCGGFAHRPARVPATGRQASTLSEAA